MKTKLCIIALLFLASCTQHSPYTKSSIQVSAIVDITDPLCVKPDAEYLIKLFDLGNEPEKEVRFRMLPVSDKLMNPVSTLILPDERTTDKENTREVPLYRKRLIRNFYDKVRKSVDGFIKATETGTTRSHSECFGTIAGELTLMKKTPASKNILMVYSDLQENSTLISAYTKDGKALLSKHPKKIQDIFSRSGLLPADLSGITMVFIYNPKDRTDDQAFRSMVSVYRKLLEDRGATVEVRANN